MARLTPDVLGLVRALPPGGTGELLAEPHVELLEVLHLREVSVANLSEVGHQPNDRAVAIAAQRGGAEELVKGLPHEWETMLGKWFDEGVNLSGGEWQKVALSRAFMRDVRILVLDEPTSALDAQAEFELFERLQSLTQGRTAVYISHRFSTVRGADRILFLEHGELVEAETPEELIRLDGRYAKLFRMQASAYVGECGQPKAAH
jgi:ATP-binding cassette subfamily B protein